MELPGTQQPQQQPRPLFFENNNNGAYSNMHPLHTNHTLFRQPSLSLSSDNPSQAASSIPGSPRHSIQNHDDTDMHAMFDKLKIDAHEERRCSSPGHEAVFSKPSHRSMSVDVGYASSAKAAGNFDAPINDLLSNNLIFDKNMPQPDMFPSNPRSHPYLQRFAGSSERLLPLTHGDSNNYTTLFPQPSGLDLSPSLRNAARHNKSVESLRSKSWAQQYLDAADPADPASLSQPAGDALLAARGSAALYGQSRRLSYGWPASQDVANTKHNNLPPNIKLKSRLTASQSYSDLHEAALRSRDYMNTSSPAQPPLPIIADMNEGPFQFQTTGVRAMEDKGSVYAQAPDAPMAHPLDGTHQFLPFMYQQYPMLNNLASHPGGYPTKSGVAHVANGMPMPSSRHSSVSYSDSLAPVTTRTNHRRQSEQETNRFAGANLEDFKGNMYELCKDQNGCRFLQKKLEESNPTNIQMIFNEVQPHFVDLMTEPFGNYLCQKLIEHSDEAQRDILVETVAPELLKISLNMHGTRAVQRFIEFLTTPHQIKVVTEALNPNVVTLIKDLNGNHVIQKCLHRLSPEHKQFIYDAVSENCTQVATHRHGCCVLQRCVDSASDAQKAQLVQVITWNALPLVQDPFGNYVVQYILDLGDIHFTDTLVRCFVGHVCELSVQKFSSNVIEKCIRVAEPETRRLLVAELTNKANIEKLLRDSFANYVVQTCLDYADPDQRVQLIELIRPLLPSIRSTPYGKRIHSKIQREQQPQGQQQQQQQRTLHRAKSDLQTSQPAIEPVLYTSSSAQTMSSHRPDLHNRYAVNGNANAYPNGGIPHAFSAAGLPLAIDPLFQFH